MSIPVVAQSFTPAVTNAVTQGAMTFSTHLYALTQYRRIAVPTLVLSTVIGTILGLAVVLFTAMTIKHIAGKYGIDDDGIKERPVLAFSALGAMVTFGLLTLASVNIGVSKLFKLPFSRLSSFGITLTTIAIPLAIGVGIYLKKRSDKQAKKERRQNVDQGPRRPYPQDSHFTTESARRHRQ